MFWTSSTAIRSRTAITPVYEEIASGLKLSSIATVHKHISALAKKNYLSRGANQSRSVEVSPRYAQEKNRGRFEHLLEVPIHGSIAAGMPVQAFDTADTLSFADFVGRKETYALRVRGNSMVDDHICDGDMILVENTQEARDGQIVVATGRRHRKHPQAAIPGTWEHDPPAAGEPDDESDSGSGQSGGSPGPPAGGSAEVLETL